MATTFVDYTGDGNATKAFSFPSYQEADVKVDVDGVIKTSGSHYNITSYTTTGGGNVVFTSGNIPTSPSLIRIFRDTDVDTAKATFTAGSSVRADDLNNNMTQILYAAQEEQNQTVVASDLKDGIITSAKIVDGTIATADIAADAITGAKIADDAINSEHYTDGSIDTAHIADAQITHVKLANDAVDGDNIADDSINSEHYVDGSIDTAHIADSQVTSAKIADGAIVNADVNASAAIAHSKLAAVPDGQVIVGNGSTVPTAVAISGDVTLANTGAVTIANDAVEIGMLGCEQTTITDSDSHIPTSGAVVDYVAAQLEPFGGLEAIATEVAFPNTQPAAGVVISIADAGGIVVNGSGTSTTGRTVGGSTVTINNINSAFNSSTVDAGVSFMVSSTGSGQVYNFHKATLKESDIINLSNDINDFGNRYRVFAGEPSSNNDEGDLVYDTSADKMKVYDSSASAWKEVTSTGEFKFLFLCPAGGSGAPTLDGSIATYDLRESSNSGAAASVTNAAQLLVSVNGVIQKANSGTSAPAEGFAMVDANTIIFGANLASGDSVFIVQIGSAVSIPTPGDNTVTSAKIVDGAIVNADINASADIAGSKLADDSITEAKLDIHNAPSGTDKFLKYTSNGLEWAVPSYTTNTDTQLSTEQVQDIAGPLVATGGTKTGITITYDDANGDMDFVVDDTTKLPLAGGTITGPLVIDDSVGATITAATSASTITLDFGASVHHSVTLAHNTTFADPSNEVAGQSGSIIITQDGTGSRTAAFNSAFKFVGGTAPTLSTAANAVDRIDYLVVAAGNIHAVVSLDIK